MSAGGNLCVFELGALFVTFDPIGIFSTLPNTLISNLFGQIWVSVSKLASNSLSVRLVLAVLDTAVKFLYLLMWELDYLAICFYYPIGSLIINLNPRSYDN